MIDQQWRLIAAFLRRAMAVAAVVGFVTQIAFGPAAAQSASAAKPIPSMMLIFDGSGSMWGKIAGEKQIKLDQARDAVRSAFGKLAAQSAQVGLMSFGHRRASDCTDVQVIATPEAADAQGLVDRILTPLEKLNPRGKGPLTAALQEAAKVLGRLPAPRHIVLLHDDPDNCQADPCEALGDLQKAAPGVVVSIVGLGLKPDDAGRYQCLTKPTGGRHYMAQDGAEVAAMIGEAIQFAALAAPSTARPSQPVAPTAAAPVDAIAGAVAKPVDLVLTGPPALRLRALLVKDRLPLDHPVRWSISADGAPAGTPPIAEVDGAEGTVTVPSATYRVRATSGLVAAETIVTAGAQGQTLAEVIFNAAEIQLAAALPGDAMMLITERDPNAKPPAATTPVRRLGLWPHGRTRVLVPPRPLTVLFEQGELRAQWPVDIAAGQAREIDTAQAGARIQLSLSAMAGPAIPGAGAFADQPVVFTLEEDDPDAPRGRREIARSAAAAPEFVVPPGVYMIAASRGGLQTRERLSVAAGEVVRRSLPLLAARLIIGARLGAGSAVPPDDRSQDTFRITRLGTDAGQPIVLPGPAVIADVPPGRYRIEARRNNAAIKAEQSVEVGAGEYRPVTLDYQAGELRVEIQTAAAADPIFWRIADSQGHLIESGSDAHAGMVLEAGRYTIRWVTSGTHNETAVDVRAGSVSAVRIGGKPLKQVE